MGTVIGERLTLARQYLGLTPTDVEKYVDIPIDILKLMEEGKKVIPSALDKLSKLYKYPISYFMGDNEFIDTSDLKLVARTNKNLNQQDIEQVSKFKEYLIFISQNKHYKKLIKSYQQDKEESLSLYREAVKFGIYKANKIHALLNSNFNNLVDVFSIIDSFNIVLMFQPLGHLAGVYIPPDYENRTLAGILINENLPLTRQRYSAAHEFCHFIQCDDASFDTSEEMFIKKYQRDYKEKIAEVFAANFLMPRALVGRTAKRLTIDLSTIDHTQTYSLALRLGTSYSATVNQLYNLKFIDIEKKEKLINIPPKLAKMNLGEIENLRNDIWLITENEDRSSFYLRLGDLVRIKLSENPTTGYIWVQENIQKELKVIKDYWEPFDMDCIGSSGDRYIEMIAEDTGLQRIKLSLKRPWEKDLHIQKFSLRFTIMKTHGISHKMLLKAV